MATTIRRGDGVGKEKKGISPSTSSTPTRKPIRSPLTSSISSSHGEKKTVSSSTTRQSPSNLRPTRTAPSEISKLSKKPITEPSAPLRRRSFAHPPPPSQVQKAISDAKKSRSATTLKNSIKSGSPLSRASSSDRPVRKEVRSSLPVLPSVKKNGLSSMSTASKRGPTKGVPLIKKATKSSMSESNLHHLQAGVSSDIDDPFASFEDELGNLDNDDVQSLPEISEMPICGSDLGDPATLLEDLVKQPIEEEDHKNLSLEDGHELEEDTSVVDNYVTEEPTPQDTTALDDVQIEEELLEENNVEEPTNQEYIEEEIGDQGVVAQEVAKDEPKETLSEVKKEDAAPIKEEERMEKEVEMKTETNMDAKTSTRSPFANSVVSRSQSMVKKENQQAYNDVIEQTASKLRSKKNKVLALAGAFETVISLQDKN